MGRQRTGRLLSFQSSQGFNTGIQGYRTRTAKLKRVGAEKQEISLLALVWMMSFFWRMHLVKRDRIKEFLLR